ncbi:hypothetical protein BDAP_002059 [Binucleata daphniae]
MLFHFLFVFTAIRNKNYLRKTKEEVDAMERKKQHFRESERMYKEQLRILSIAWEEYDRQERASSNRFSEHEYSGIQNKLDNLKSKYEREKQKADQLLRNMIEAENSMRY